MHATQSFAVALPACDPPPPPPHDDNDEDEAKEEEEEPLPLRSAMTPR